MQLKKRQIKKYLKKFWWLLWKDDSLKGWFFSVIFLVVFIMLIFFPLLRLATGTALPLAIVESCSMYHEGNILSNFDSWYEKHDSKYAEYIINNLDFQEFPFKNGFTKGDILFIIRANPDKLKQGDVIIFNSGLNKNPIIHRIIKIEEGEERSFATLGDNNNGQLSFEKDIQESQLVGKAVFRIAPYLGWTKLVFFERNRLLSERGFCDEN